MPVLEQEPKFRQVGDRRCGQGESWTEQRRPVVQVVEEDERRTRLRWETQERKALGIRKGGARGKVRSGWGVEAVLQASPEAERAHE